MFIENDSILISISRKQWISLLSVLPDKLVTPSSTICTTSALLRMGQPKLFDQLNRCAPSKTVYYHHRIHYQRINGNVVYNYLSYSVLKLNELQSGHPINV